MSDHDIRPGAGKGALVTGASAGIGAAFARLLAQEGFDLVLTARRKDRLEALAEKLRGTCGVKVAISVADLAETDAPKKIFADADAAGVPIDFLVNNAGYAITGQYDESAWAEHARFLQVMATAPAELAHIALPRMRQRGWGRIVNVASLAGLSPGTAGHTLYAPVKAFLVKLSESLSFEGAKDDVAALALCPGFTFSEFHDVAGNRDHVSELPEWMWMSAEEVVAQGYDAAMKGNKPVHVTGFANKAIAALVRVMPDPAVYALTRRIMAKARMAKRAEGPDPAGRMGERAAPKKTSKPSASAPTPAAKAAAKEPAPAAAKPAQAKRAQAEKDPPKAAEKSPAETSTTDAAEKKPATKSAAPKANPTKKATSASKSTPSDKAGPAAKMDGDGDAPKGGADKA